MPHRNSTSARAICFGDYKVNCQLLQRQLTQEVGDLSRRITLLQQTNQPNLGQLQHLGGILKSRQAVLHWLQTSDGIGA